MVSALFDLFIYLFRKPVQIYDNIEKAYAALFNATVMRYSDCVYDFEDRKSLGKSKEWRLQMTAKPNMILTIWASLLLVSIFFIWNSDKLFLEKNKQKLTENIVQLQANGIFRSISNFYSYYSSLFTLVFRYFIRLIALRFSVVINWSLRWR